MFQVKNIAIFLKEDDSEDEKENKDNNVEIDPMAFGRGKRTAVLDHKLRDQRVKIKLIQPCLPGFPNKKWHEKKHVYY